MIRLGYACLHTQLPSPSRTFRLAGYSPARMLETAEGNLRALKAILEWNAEHGIHVFRVTSGLVPFASHAVGDSSWRTALAPLFAEAGAVAAEAGIRLSMHPGQYTLLGSPDPRVTGAALRDLHYHAAVLDLLGAGPDGRIVLHCGGAYGDLACALDRVESAYRALPERLRSRIAFENDDRVCSAEAMLDFCHAVGAPAVFDTLHHTTLPSLPAARTADVIRLFGETWPDGERQKVHYSDQDLAARAGAHAEHVDVESFGRFLAEVADMELDVMLEVKDKERSLLTLRERFDVG